MSALSCLIIYDDRLALMFNDDIQSFFHARKNNKIVNE